MIWFEMLFPAVMLLSPLAFVLCTRPHPERAADDAPRRLRHLLRATSVAVAVYVAVALAADAGLEGTLALWRGWNIALPVTFSLLLWFRFAVPALVARRPGWGDPRVASSQRSASLTPRHVAPGGDGAGADAGVLPIGAWVVGWALALAGLAVSVLAVVDGAPAVLLLGGAFFPGFAWAARAVRTEAEPRDAQGSAELAAAYADLRRFRAWAFWICGVSGALAFGATAWFGREGGLDGGMVGGLGGAAVGLLGAVLGSWASIKRARVHELLQDLQQQGEGC